MSWASRFRTQASKRDDHHPQSLAAEERQQVGGEDGGVARAFEDGGGEFPLVAVQRHDLLFDRAARDEPVDRDRIRLPDAVGAVRRLVLDGGVEPASSSSSDRRVGGEVGGQGLPAPPPPRYLPRPI